MIDWDSVYGTCTCENDLILMKSKNCARVAEGEFMKNLDDWKNRHGEKDHFWIKGCAKDFLKLDEAGHENEIFTFEYALDVGRDKVASIASDHDKLVFMKFS